jgi:hypothetical protein
MPAVPDVDCALGEAHDLHAAAVVHAKRALNPAAWVVTANTVKECAECVHVRQDGFEPPYPKNLIYSQARLPLCH